MIKYNKSMLRKVLIACAIVSLSGGCVANNGGRTGREGDSYSSLSSSKSSNIKEILNASLFSAAKEAEDSQNYKEAAKHYITLLDKLENGEFGDKNGKEFSIKGDSGKIAGSYAIIKERFVLGVAKNLRYAGEHEGAMKTLSIYEKEIRDAQRKDAANTDANTNAGGEILSEQMALEFAKSLISTKKPEAAIVRLERLISEGQKSWEVYSVLGIAYDHKNQFVEAMKAYKQSLKSYPDNPDVLNNVGLSLALSGDIYGAIEIFENLVRNVDSQPQYRQNLAILLALNGDLERASDLAYQDLPYDMATRNAKTYRDLMEKPNY